MPVTEFLTTKQVAALLCVDIGKVGDWLAAGDLVGVNVARVSGGIRPRWRISREALNAFIASRQSQQPATPAPRRKRQQEQAAYY